MSSVQQLRSPLITAPRPQMMEKLPGPPSTVPDGFFFDASIGQLCRVNPLGIIEPPHTGAFFFDKQNGVFYRADGPTAFDWGLVTPREMIGGACMVRSFVDFLSPAHHAMTAKERIDVDAHIGDPHRPPHILDGGKMAEVGVRIDDARCWRARDLRVMQARIRVEVPKRIALFVGFCSPIANPTQPVAAAHDVDGMRVYDPGAIGVAFDDKFDCSFGVIAGQVRENSGCDLRARDFDVRVELGLHQATVHLDGEIVQDLPRVHALSSSDAVSPRMALFCYGRPA